MIEPGSRSIVTGGGSVGAASNTGAALPDGSASVGLERAAAALSFLDTASEGAVITGGDSGGKVFG
jgi:hypothetical protein